MAEKQIVKHDVEKKYPLDGAVDKKNIKFVPTETGYKMIYSVEEKYEGENFAAWSSKSMEHAECFGRPVKNQKMDIKDGEIVITLDFKDKNGSKKICGDKTCHNEEGKNGNKKAKTSEAEKPKSEKPKEEKSKEEKPKEVKKVAKETKAAPKAETSKTKEKAVPTANKKASVDSNKKKTNL